jgi:putative oxidoreductase
MNSNAKIRRRLLDGFILAVRLALGCLFLASSLPKLRQPYDFLGSVYSYELIGPKLGVFVAIILPWLELFVGVSLIGGIFVGGALLVSIAMSAMFTFVLASALWRGLDISCGCFSPSGVSIIGYSTLIRAAAMLAAASAVYVCVIMRPNDLAAGLPHE